MPEGSPGQLVAVKTKFHREAIRPGGVNRGGANISSQHSIAALKADVEAQIAEAVEPLVALLRGWNGKDAAKGCRWAAQTRDLAGLAGLHLLTEVAMHSYDCLDAVAVDGVSMRPEEAACYADALVFSRHDLCRGGDLDPYEPLLTELRTLTGRIFGRAQTAR